MFNKYCITNIVFKIYFAVRYIIILIIIYMYFLYNIILLLIFDLYIYLYLYLYIIPSIHHRPLQLYISTPLQLFTSISIDLHLYIYRFTPLYLQLYTSISIDLHLYIYSFTPLYPLIPRHLILTRKQRYEVDSSIPPSGVRNLASSSGVGRYGGLRQFIRGVCVLRLQAPVENTRPPPQETRRTPSPTGSVP